jgi:hypothetical protein
MSINLHFIKVLLSAGLLLALLSGCGLFRANETPVIVVMASPTPEAVLWPMVTPIPEVVVGPPHVEVEILETPLPELFAGFATPTHDPFITPPPVFIVVPPTPTATPWVIIITATPIPPTPFIPTPTPDLGVVLPVTGGDLTVQPAATGSFWSLGLIFMGLLLVSFGIFRRRR